MHVHDLNNLKNLNEEQWKKFYLDLTVMKHRAGAPDVIVGKTAHIGITEIFLGVKQSHRLTSEYYKTLRTVTHGRICTATSAS